MARMPVLRASGSVGHASISRRRSSSKGGFPLLLLCLLLGFAWVSSQVFVPSSLAESPRAFVKRRSGVRVPRVAYPKTPLTIAPLGFLCCAAPNERRTNNDARPMRALNCALNCFDRSKFSLLTSRLLVRVQLGELSRSPRNSRRFVVNGPVAIGVGRYPSRHIHTEANPLRDRRGLSRFADCRGLRADSGRGNSRVVNDRQVGGRAETQRVSLGSLCRVARCCARNVSLSVG